MVVVLGSRALDREELRLHRSERRFAGDGLGVAFAGRLAQPLRQSGDRGEPVEVLQVVLVSPVAQRPLDLDGSDRIAAEREEVVVDSDRLGAQEASPDLVERRLLRSRGRDGGRLAVGSRAEALQGAPVELVVGIERERVEAREPAGDHVLGQQAEQVLLELGLRDVPTRRVEGDEVASAADVRDVDHALAYALEGLQPELDLAQLDASTSDLDLEVARVP